MIFNRTLTQNKKRGQFLKLLVEKIQYYLMMLAGFKFIENMLNFTGLIKQKANTMNTVISFAHKFFLTPYTELFRHLMIFIS